MKYLWPLVLVVGCIEYTPTSTMPPGGAVNVRPVETPTQTDRLVQVLPPEVDVLWVIDNSSSMSDEQAALTTNFPAFMDFFLGSGLLYHIGVVSTDYATDQGRLEQAAGLKWVDENTADPIAVFASLAGLGIKFGTNEKGRAPAYSALEVHDVPDGWNDGFQRRDTASLSVIAISDEDDHSTEITIDEFVGYMNTIRPNPDNVTFSSIVTPPQNCAPNGVEPGNAYIAVTDQVGGITWSICEQDWALVLEQLGMQAAGLQREYFLADLPVPGTIKVWVVEDGTTYEFAEEVDWVYDKTRNSIIFNEFVPKALSEVFVEYDVLSAAEG